MKKLYFCLSMLVLLLVTSCRQDDGIGRSVNLQPGEYLFSVTFPEPTETVSRGMGETLDLQGKEMHVLVFDQNGFFVANQKAESVEQGEDKYTYKVSLPPSETPCALHFILGELDYPTFVTDDSEVSVFTNLSVSGNKDAYWQRVEVDAINDNILLPQISLIRNFAKISVDSQVSGSFEFIGFAVVRNTDAGTVAPYVGPTMSENGGFAVFDKGYTYDDFISRNTGYGGNTVGSVVEDEPTAYDTAPKYVYERNQDNAQRPAYVLVKAKWNGNECYYKLDIVSTNAGNYVTSYLNLYRNFHYLIHITSVKEVGYSTAREAMQAAASNNIGASVEVSQVNEIQDGRGHKLWVSTLDTLVVSSAPAEIHYSYTVPADENNQVFVTPVSEGTDGLNEKAISSYELMDGVLKVTPVSPLPELMETQEFVLSTPSGLSRRITVNVRQPFSMRVDCDDMVAEEIGEDLTLVVVLPNNMPTAVFPLTLEIEPNKKSLYPDVLANRIPVHSDGNYSFDYQGVVTYAEYLRSHTCHFVFKTNMKTSATSITVLNPYFENINNTASFYNGTARYDFGSVTLNGREDSFTFGSYDVVDKHLKVEFDLHTEGDGYQSSGDHPVYIYPSNPERMNLEATTSSTGKVEITEERYITYTPYNLTGRQEITFLSIADLPTGVIQLTAMDHATETISYNVPPLNVHATYGNSQLVTGTIEIYDNSAYSGNPILEFKATNGEFTIDTFGGASKTDICYFQYVSGNFTYRCSMSVGELINSPSIVLQSGY